MMLHYFSFFPFTNIYNFDLCCKIFKYHFCAAYENMATLLKRGNRKFRYEVEYYKIKSTTFNFYIWLTYTFLQAN